MTIENTPETHGGLTRRRALCGLVVAFAAPAALAACSSASEAPPATPTGGSGAGTTGATGGAAGTTTAAPAAGGTPVAQVPVGGGLVVDGPNGPVVLTQPQAGVIKAFDAACPHQGTTVDPPEGGTITCPNHGSEFDATSGALKKGPAESGLTPVATTVVNGQVQFA